MMLNEIEQDFIEFVAQRNNESIEAVGKRYQISKETISFESKDFLAHIDLSYQTLQVFFSEHSERSLLESYRYYAFPDMLRMISYSFPKTATMGGYVRTFANALAAGDVEKITDFLKRKMTREKKISLQDRMLSNRDAPVIVDYGCGLGYLSYDLAKKSPGAHVVLVDLDTAKLDFTEFRFKKHGIPFTTLRLSAEHQYPILPEHSICIATDVMEHLHKPLLAYQNIRDNMLKGGVLYGNFEDHERKLFHVHPEMSDLREAVQKDYKRIAPGLYEKMD